MNADSTAERPTSKPSKAKSKRRRKRLPEGFPLRQHASGRWYKAIRRNFYYFGKIADDPDGQAALELWTEQKDYLLAGKKPPADRDGLTVEKLCAEFLVSKRRRLDAAEIHRATFRECRETCRHIVKVFGKRTFVENLQPADFRRLRKKLDRLSPVTVLNAITRIRGVFIFAKENQLIDRDVNFGTEFKRPPRRVLRKERKKNGPRMFESAELRQILGAARQPLKAMVLLGVNCGFGQSDIGNLTRAHVDLETGFVDYPRPKTEIDRRCPLWPETVAALRESLKLRARRIRIDIDCRQLFFVTERGKAYVRYSDIDDNGRGGARTDGIGQEFNKLLRSLGIKRTGVAFYALRHTLETIGGESRDQVAVDYVMGHARDDMASVYRERISGDERLLDVTSTVRRWLFDTGTEARNVP